MCGRFHVNEIVIEEIGTLVRDSHDRMWMEAAGDICPSQRAWVLTGKKGELTLEEMEWGFPLKERKTLLINARAERVMERPLFYENVRRRRCAIPAGGYYEWDNSGNKIEFSGESQQVLYMAGIYDLYDGRERFVVLTTEANETVRKVHHRMPLILMKEDVEAWICDEAFWPLLLQKIPPGLKQKREYEQQSFLDLLEV